MKPVTKAFNRMLSVLFATLAGAALFGLWVARHLAKPLLKLTEGAKTIAAGHFDARVVVTSRDEIGVLANAFNQMADALDVTLSALKGKSPNAPRLRSRLPARRTSWSSA